MSDFFEPLPPDAPPEKIPTLVTSSAKMGNPGPASYETRGDLIKNIPKIPIRNRFEEKVELTNAPYRDLPSCIGAGYKFTLKGRPRDLDIESTPGPEYVSKPLGSDAPKCAIHVKASAEHVEQTPGPGEYKISSPFGNPKRGATFHGPRDRSMKRANDSPGPGAYAPRSPKTTREIKIGRRNLNEHIEETPGPGQYMTPRLAPNKDKGYIGRHLSTSVDTSGPGPASYNTESNILNQMPRIYMHGRTKEHTDITTAPYQDTRPKYSGPRYSMRSRYDPESTDVTPGPEYVPEAFGKGSRGVKIHGVTRSERKESTPGPASYRATKEFGSDARKSTFHGPRTRALAVNDSNPSPADYSYDMNGVKPSSPRVSIGRRTARHHVEQTGEYVNLGSTLKGPRYSMRARPTLDVSFG